MSDLYQISANLRANVADLTRVESPSAALTLTRSATLAITTAGTIITWQVETRNQGFTWSGTDITIPTAGYYNISFVFSTSANIAPLIYVRVNSVLVSLFSHFYTGFNRGAAVMQRYFATGDLLSVYIVPNVNVNINVVAEDTANESPILNIVQLTGVI